jgi:hypothetical protein
VNFQVANENKRICNRAHLEPDIALRSQDRQADEENNETDEDDASDAVVSREKEMTILSFLVFSKSKLCPEILAHPVAQTFLDMKWDRMKGHLLFINIGLRITIYALYIFLAMRIYFYDCPHHRPGRNYTSTMSQQEDKTAAMNSSQSEGVVECDWSLWTLVPLPILLLFLSLFLVHEIMKADRFRKCEKKLFTNKITYLRVSYRMLCFLLQIGTTIPPLFQRSLLAFQYPLAVVCIWVGLCVYWSYENCKRRKILKKIVRSVCCLQRFSSSK